MNENEYLSEITCRQLESDRPLVTASIVAELIKERARRQAAG